MLRFGIAFLMLAVAAGAADKAAAKAGVRKAGAAPAARAAGAVNVPLTIPAAAREVEPGLWEHKDAKGKTWHYTKTPFGVRRFEPELIEDDSAREADYITAVDKGGDEIEFERKTPFGKAKWTRKRGDLNDAEKLAVERSRSGR
jgi:hypothetical protein